MAAGAKDAATTLAVRDYCASKKAFCLIFGGAGSGKTIAACEALLNSRMAWEGAGGKVEWSYSPSEARFVLTTDLARLSYFDTEAMRVLGRMERVPWLVLDDMGGELLTDTWKSNLTDLILARNSARRRTLITTNLPVDAFKERYDERIISRIRGDGVVIAAGNVDQRRLT